MRLLAQVDRIEDAAERADRAQPRTSARRRDVALVMMLFEAARLGAENEHDPASERRRHRHDIPANAE